MNFQLKINVKIKLSSGLNGKNDMVIDKSMFFPLKQYKPTIFIKFFFHFYFFYFTKRLCN